MAKYKWEIVYHLRDGKTLTGMHKTDKADSNDVLKELMSGDVNTFTPVYVASGDMDGILAVRRGDVSAVELYVWKG